MDRAFKKIKKVPSGSRRSLKYLRDLFCFYSEGQHLFYSTKHGSRTKPGGLGKKSGKSVEEEGPVFDAA